MWHSRTILMVIAGAFLSFVSAAHADSLQLKDGNFVQGKYLGGTERAVQFEANGKVRIYDINEILSISFAAASADGGIPSNEDDQKPSTRTGLNPVENDKSTGLNTLVVNNQRASKPLSTRISVRQNEIWPAIGKSCVKSVTDPRSRFGDGAANVGRKPRLSPIVAHPVRPLTPDSAVLSN